MKIRKPTLQIDLARFLVSNNRFEKAIQILEKEILKRKDEEILVELDLINGILNRYLDGKKVGILTPSEEKEYKEEVKSKLTEICEQLKFYEQKQFAIDIQSKIREGNLVEANEILEQLLAKYPKHPKYERLKLGLPLFFRNKDSYSDIILEENEVIYKIWHSCCELINFPSEEEEKLDPHKLKGLEKIVALLKEDKIQQAINLFSKIADHKSDFQLPYTLFSLEAQWNIRHNERHQTDHPVLNLTADRNRIAKSFREICEEIIAKNRTEKPLEYINEWIKAGKFLQVEIVLKKFLSEGSFTSVKTVIDQYLARYIDPEFFQHISSRYWHTRLWQRFGLLKSDEAEKTLKNSQNEFTEIIDRIFTYEYDKGKTPIPESEQTVLLEEVTQLIGQSEIDHAIQKIKPLLAGKFSHLNFDLEKIATRFQYFQNQKASGFLNPKQLFLKENKIRADLWDIIEQIHFYFYPNKTEVESSQAFVFTSEMRKQMRDRLIEDDFQGVINDISQTLPGISIESKGDLILLSGRAISIEQMKKDRVIHLGYKSGERNKIMSVLLDIIDQLEDKSLDDHIYENIDDINTFSSDQILKWINVNYIREAILCLKKEISLQKNNELFHQLDKIIDQAKTLRKVTYRGIKTEEEIFLFKNLIARNLLKLWKKLFSWQEINTQSTKNQQKFAQADFINIRQNMIEGRFSEVIESLLEIHSLVSRKFPMELFIIKNKVTLIKRESRIEIYNLPYHNTQLIQIHRSLLRIHQSLKKMATH
ncbi:MAG: hypothetical protein R3B93_01120 [Bacteroidia bacterium]